MRRMRKRTVVVASFVVKTILGMMIVIVVTVQYRLGSTSSSRHSRGTSGSGRSSSTALMRLQGGGDDTSMESTTGREESRRQEMDVLQEQEEEQQQNQQQMQQLQSLPSWMETYLTWHTETRRRWLSLSKDEDKDKDGSSPPPRPLLPKLLILICTSEQSKCGGLSDRLKPLPLLVLGAYKTNRLLLIHWSHDRPTKLEHFLRPPTMSTSTSTSTPSSSSSLPVLDWTVPDDIASRLFPVASSSTTDTATSSGSSSTTTTTTFNVRRKHLTNTRTFIENLMKFDSQNNDDVIITATLQWWDGGYQSYTNERIRMMMMESKNEIEEEEEQNKATMKNSTSKTTTTTTATITATSTNDSKAHGTEIEIRQEYYTYYSRLWSRTFRPTRPIQHRLDKIYDEMRRLSSSDSDSDVTSHGDVSSQNQGAAHHDVVDYAVAHYRALWWEDQTVPSVELQEEITQHAIECAVRTKLKFQFQFDDDNSDDDEQEQQEEASTTTKLASSSSSSSSSLVVYFATDSIDAQQYVMNSSRNNETADSDSHMDIIKTTTMSLTVDDDKDNNNNNSKEKTVDLHVVTVPHKSVVHLDRVRILDEKEETQKQQDDDAAAGTTTTTTTTTTRKTTAAADDGDGGDGDTTTNLAVDKSVQTVRNVEEIYPVFVDLLLLGGGSCISYGDGGYGQFGSLLQQTHLQRQRKAVGHATTTTNATTKTKKKKASSSLPSASSSYVPDAMICSKRYIKRHKLQPC